MLRCERPEHCEGHEPRGTTRTTAPQSRKADVPRAPVSGPKPRGKSARGVGATAAGNIRFEADILKAGDIKVDAGGSRKICGPYRIDRVMIVLRETRRRRS